MAAQNMSLERLIEAGEEKGFEVEQDADFGAGPVDVVWNINVHTALPNIKLGFIVLGGEEEGGGLHGGLHGGERRAAEEEQRGEIFSESLKK